MSVKTKDELLEAIKAKIGDVSDDATLGFVEDVVDTLNDLDNRANNDNENWKKKYEENDKEWREKYKERFFSNPDEDSPDEDDEQEPKKAMRFEDLFSEKEG